MADHLRVSEQPRAVAIIDGIPVLPKAYHLDINAHGTADTGTITIPMTRRDWSARFAAKQPINASVEQLAKLPGTVGSSPALIYAGYPTAPSQSSTDITDLSLRFRGIIDFDKPSFHGGEVTFDVRNLGSLLVANKTTTAAQNQTSVQFLKAACAKVGMAYNVQLRDGQEPVTLAQVYAHDFVVGIRNVKDWDILKQCSQVDDVQLWVDELGVLNYVAPEKVRRRTCDLVWGVDLVTLEGEHSGQYSRNIEVEVRSYTPKTRYSTYTRHTTGPDGKAKTTSGERFTVSNPVFGTGAGTTTSTSTNAQGGTSSTTSSGVSSGGSSNSGFTNTRSNENSSRERFIFHIANLTRKQCNDRAFAIWRQISMHERQVRFGFPMTAKLLPFINITTFFRISEVEWPSWNDTYWPRRLTEDFVIPQGHAQDSTSGGWTVACDAVNHELAMSAV